MFFYLVIKQWILLHFVSMWNKKRHTETLDLILYRFWFSTCLIFILTTKRTGFSRFRFPDFAFQLLSCVIRCFCRVCVRKDRAELMKQGEPPPPESCVWVYMDRLSLAIFFPSQLKKVVKTKQNNRLEFKLVHIEIDSNQVENM